VGDEVETLDYHTNRIGKGKKGVICIIYDEERVGVNFRTNIRGHSCDNTCEFSFGWYFWNEDLKLSKVNNWRDIICK
jgi:hypothetical protein